MNREWSELNKLLQQQLRKRDTFKEGLNTLFQLRAELMDVIMWFKAELDSAEFCAQPFPNAKGYHSKTVAYSLWHIFRIEDIVSHTLVKGDEQVLFSGNYQKRINLPIITTGNELSGAEIAEFSEKLDIAWLYSYISEVRDETEKMLADMEYERLKEKIMPERREMLEALNVVDGGENSVWLIDYWCGKDIRGLIQMPFSRHWIMHIEACLRICDRLKKM